MIDYALMFIKPNFIQYLQILSLSRNLDILNTKGSKEALVIFKVCLIASP